MVGSKVLVGSAGALGFGCLGLLLAHPCFGSIFVAIVLHALDQ